jgi:lipopolysaccharide export system permease protein
MFPIIWRFLLNQYLKVMALCVAAIITVLLTTRLEDIAHFASLDASLGILLLFVLYQIPYILPIAIPVACLVSSILLVQRLSQTHELTALRACGMALKDFITPILIAGSFLAILNFYLVSETATVSHLYTNLWKSELRSVNPLLLLKNKHLMKLRGAYFDALGASRVGESASQVVMAMPSRAHQRINLLLADNMVASRDNLNSSGVTFVTTIEGNSPDDFDHLVIENIEESTVSAEDFSQLIQRKVWNVNNDHLRMPFLLTRLKEEKERLAKAEMNPSTASSEIKGIKKSINRCYSEIMRRLSAALAAFTFTLMGASFGITISRNRSNRSILYVVAIAGAYLATYFAGKGVENQLIASILLYTLPHLAIIIMSIWMLKRISKGIDES